MRAKLTEPPQRPSLLQIHVTVKQVLFGNEAETNVCVCVRSGLTLQPGSKGGSGAQLCGEK